MSFIDRLAQLNALHLYGMAAAWSELLAEGPRRPIQPEAWLDRLIGAELVDRQVRSLRYQLKAARFPVHRDLTSIEWAETPLPQAGCGGQHRHDLGVEEIDERIGTAATTRLLLR